MNERFDDMIRRQMDGLKSPVPQDMFDKIRSQPDVSDTTFDAGLKNKLQSAESPVSPNLFDKMNTEGDLANAAFDGAVLQKIGNYESAVPADMWRRITTNKRRRRPVAWWWVAAGIILLFLGGTWFTLQYFNGKNEQTTAEFLAKKEDSSFKASTTQTDLLNPEDATTPILSDSSRQRTSTIEDSVIVSRDGFKNESSSTNNKVVGTKNIRKNTSEKTQPKESFSKYTKLVRKSVQAAQTAKTQNKNGFEPGYNPELLNSNNGKEDVGDIATITHSLQSPINQQLRNAAKLLPGQLLKAKPRLPVIPCPTNDNEHRNTWYVDLYTSAFGVQKNVSDKAGRKNVKNSFDSTLHQQLSYSAGINLVKNIGNNLLVKTGVQYSRTNESFRLTRINERKLITTTSIRSVIIAPGDTVYIRDTSVSEHIGTIQRRTQNKYQQWDVPVIIGYEFGGENIRLNANAGIIANISSAYSGEMLADTSQNIIDVKNYNGKPVYKTNVGFSLYAGLSIVKPMGERTSLVIEPYARIGLQNMATNSAWFKQKNSAAGIAVGLRYQLNGGGQRR
jgi:hypothetical protein